MRLNKKGFVASGVLYSLLLLFLALILGLLALLSNRKMILDKLKKDIKNDIIQVNTYDYYENGTIIYYNPVTGKICSDYTEDNSKTGVKEGCLKWYAFNDNIGNANVNMILDHNTTATIEWISDTDYGSSAKNDKGPITANNQLKSDTENWNKNLNTRLISANEIATIVGNIDWNSENIESTPFYFHDLSNEVTTGRGDVCASSGCKYSWLYDRTRNNCTTYGCLNNSLETNTYGYWTSSLVAGETTSAWYINYYGHFDNHNVVNASKYYGVRPVITVPKKNIENMENIILNINNMVLPLKTEKDGSKWARVFYHNNVDGTVLFINEAEAKLSSKTNKVSALTYLESFRKNDGNFEFWLAYPNDTDKYNRWIQTSNPIEELIANGDGTETATGYLPVHIDFTKHSWGGLTLSTRTATYLDGAVGHSNWNYAIGAYEKYGAGIPSAIQVDNDDGVTTSVVELWVRADDYLNKN